MTKYINKLLIFLLGLFFISSLVGCSKNNNTTTEHNKGKTNNNITKKENKDAKYIYVVSAKKDKPDNLNLDDMEMMMNCEGRLVKVEVDKNITPEKALEYLFNYKDNDKFLNPLQHLQNLKVKDIIIKNNFAIVKLAEGLNIKKTICDRQTIGDQIRKTLTQFDNIAGVDIFVGDKEFNSYFDELRFK